MKKLILIFSLIVITITNSYSQIGEDIASGVIDFLLKNPKTANRMAPAEKVALDIIGDLFKTAGNRKHALNYATAGQDEIIINTNQGSPSKDC